MLEHTEFQFDLFERPGSQCCDFWSFSVRTVQPIYIFLECRSSNQSEFDTIKLNMVHHVLLLPRFVGDGDSHMPLETVYIYARRFILAGLQGVESWVLNWHFNNGSCLPHMLQVLLLCGTACTCQRSMLPSVSLHWETQACQKMSVSALAWVFLKSDIRNTNGTWPMFFFLYLLLLLRFCWFV